MLTATPGPDLIQHKVSISQSTTLRVRVRQSDSPLHGAHRQVREMRECQRETYDLPASSYQVDIIYHYTILLRHPPPPDHMLAHSQNVSSKHRRAGSRYRHGLLQLTSLLEILKREGQRHLYLNVIATSEGCSVTSGITSYLVVLSVQHECTAWGNGAHMGKQHQLSQPCCLSRAYSAQMS